MPDWAFSIGRVERLVLVMAPIVIDEIPFQVSFADLMAKLRIKADSGLAADLGRLVEQAQALARPKALYKAAYIDERDGDEVVIDGIRFTSRVLQVNLEQVGRVFPHVATCGMELQDWADGIDDMLQNYWAETIKEVALRAARTALFEHLSRTYRLGETAVMSPGSLEDWPIQQQRQLFTLLGDTEAAIGVRLTDSMLMIPTKSVSGIRFPTEHTFESCMLCPREDCQTVGRRIGRSYMRRSTPTEEDRSCKPARS